MTIFGWKGHRGQNVVENQRSRSRPEVSRVPWTAKSRNPTPGLSISAFFIGIIGIGIMTIFVIWMIKYVNLEFVDHQNDKRPSNNVSTLLSLTNNTVEGINNFNSTIEGTYFSK